VTDAPFQLPLGRARVARHGTDATIVTWGIGVLWALEEAEHQGRQGRSIEVIDLRTLVPWDREAVLASVKRTSRVLVLHEAPRTAGFGAEIAASVAEECFAFLDAPPVRVAGEDIPVPFATSLERKIYSAQARLRPALERLLAF
jgi:2-oxoisovalerate dehydrogenase E1 component